MPRISRRRYFRLVDRIIMDHCCDFFGQPNYPLIREIAETERLFRKDSWPRPLGILSHVVIRESIAEIEQEVLQDFPADTFAGPPLPAQPLRRQTGGAAGTWMDDLPTDIDFWDPLGVFSGHLELLHDLHRLERRHLGKADSRLLEV